MSNISVMLVDDHRVVREGIKYIINSQNDMKVVAEATDGDEVISILKKVKVDVMLLDIKMKNIGGLALIPRVTKEFRSCSIIVLSMYDNPNYVFESIRAGAKGYLLKDVSSSELVQAIRSVYRGNGFLQSSVTLHVLKKIATDMQIEKSKLLTTTELGILSMLSEGRRYKEIAKAFSISEETVKRHLKNVYEKLGASDKTEAVAIALRQRIID
jgi:DNA-binding NarL/FixJ family response regulator